MVNNYYENVQVIDEIVKHKQTTPDRFRRLFQTMELDSALKDYFFKSTIDAIWFLPLKKAQYFDPNHILFDKEGFALFWSALDYLERVSENIANNPEYGKDLIEIIDNIVKLSQSERRINNYHIWWYCVKILNNIPAQVILDNLDGAQFRSWLGVWTEHSLGKDLAISDIGEKLLPKFLADEYDQKYDYAENIIDVITEIKSGAEKESFTKREEALLRWDSYWINNAFRKNHELIGMKCSIKVVCCLADRLRQALEYKQKSHYVNIENGSDVYQIKVVRVSEGGAESGSIKFVDGKYKCFVKQYSVSQLEAMDREKDFWTLHNIEPQRDLAGFEFVASNKKTMVLEVKQNLPKDIKWSEAVEFEKKLGSIYEGLYSDYSHIWFKSLASSGREHDSGAEEVLTTALRGVLLAKCNAAKEEGKQVLNLFLSKQYVFPIFRRFVLLCADKYWTDYSEYLDRCLKSSINPLEETDLEVELHDIFLNHGQEFSVSLKEAVKKLIDAVPSYYVDEGEKVSAYWKFKWLSPLRNVPEYSAAYEEVKQKAELKDGRPYEPDRVAFKGGAVIHKAPISKDSMMQMPIPELVGYLKEFKGADSWHGAFEGEPDKEGLASVLQAAVKENPNKFTSEMIALSEAGYFYIHYVLRGLKDVWSENREIEWEKIFDFGISYFGQGEKAFVNAALKAQGEDSGKGKYLWVVEDFVDLIEEGSNDDKRAFHPDLFAKVEEIFDLTYPLLKGEMHPDVQRDALTYALNTTLGRVIRTYITFALRKARATKTKEDSWGEHRYERFFAIGIDAHIWFGCYLPQMKYLDEKYAIAKLEAFAKSPADDFEWKMFMEGYLSGSRVYREIYSLMRSNYLKGIQSQVLEDRPDNRLVEHIGIGYLQLDEFLQPQNEDGQDSLFWIMLMTANDIGKRDRWLDVVSFFWTLTGKAKRKKDKDSDEGLSDEEKKQIVTFWAWTFSNQNVVKDHLSEDYSAFLGRLAELTNLLDKIDEEKEKWLLLCAPHIDSHQRATFFMKYLTEFEDEESVKRIGKIFRVVLETTTPTFKQEDIELIVRRIYAKGVRDDADVICNTYGKRGVHFLKHIWEENQTRPTSDS